MIKFDPCEIEVFFNTTMEEFGRLINSRSKTHRITINLEKPVIQSIDEGMISKHFWRKIHQYDRYILILPNVHSKLIHYVNSHTSFDDPIRRMIFRWASMKCKTRNSHISTLVSWIHDELEHYTVPESQSFMLDCCTLFVNLVKNVIDFDQIVLLKETHSLRELTTINIEYTDILYLSKKTIKELTETKPKNVALQKWKLSKTYYFSEA